MPDEHEKKARELYTQWEEGDHSTEGLITAVAAALREKEAEIARLKAENLELSHTPNRLAEVEAERDYFQQEMQMARKEYEELANAILADERRK